MKRVIGITSEGLEISNIVSPHFGHCKYFVGIDINNLQIIKIPDKKNINPR